VGEASFLNLEVITLKNNVGTPIPYIVDNGNFTVIPSPMVQIINILEKQFMNKSTVNVLHELSGTLIDVDHLHYKLDNWSEINVYNSTYTFFGVEDGNHTINIWLADSNDIKLPNNEAHDIVNFTIDTSPPSLLYSIPFNESIDVPVSNRIISFNFNEPMQPNYSVTWWGVTEDMVTNMSSIEWSSDKKNISFTFDRNLLADTMVRWDLNPSSLEPGFKDLAGNPLPIDVYSGGFNTVSLPFQNNAQVHVNLMYYANTLNDSITIGPQASRYYVGVNLENLYDLTNANLTPPINVSINAPGVIEFLNSNGYLIYNNLDTGYWSYPYEIPEGREESIAEIQLPDTSSNFEFNVNRTIENEGVISTNGTYTANFSITYFNLTGITWTPIKILLFNDSMANSWFIPGSLVTDLPIHYFNNHSNEIWMESNISALNPGQNYNFSVQYYVELNNSPIILKPGLWADMELGNYKSSEFSNNGTSILLDNTYLPEITNITVYLPQNLSWYRFTHLHHSEKLEFVIEEFIPPTINLPPQIYLINPQNNSVIKNNNQTINLSIIDENLDYVWYSHDNSNILLQYPYIINISTWNDGVHQINVSAEDLEGLSNNSIFSFTIDFTNPNITKFYSFPKAPYIDDPIIFTAKIYDESDITVSLEYSLDYGDTYQSISMLETSPGTYSATIGPFYSQSSFIKTRVLASDGENIQIRELSVPIKSDKPSLDFNYRSPVINGILELSDKWQIENVEFNNILFDNNDTKINNEIINLSFSRNVSNLFSVIKINASEDAIINISEYFDTSSNNILTTNFTDGFEVSFDKDSIIQANESLMLSNAKSRRGLP